MGYKVVKSMIKVIIVNGRPGAGKTTFEDICQAIMGPFCRQRSTVDRVKDIAKAAGWNGEKTAEARKFLSDLKQLLVNFNDLPFKDIKTSLRVFEDDLESYGLSKACAVLLVDSREPKEIQRFKDELGAITLLIRRPAAEQLSTSNASDEGVFDYKYDYEITNDGTINDLWIKATEFLDLIFEENYGIINIESKRKCKE